MKGAADMAKKSKKLKDEKRASRGGVLVEEARAQDLSLIHI